MKTAATVLAFLMLLASPVISAPESGEYASSASGAVLMDAETGTVLFEKNADAKHLIASTTKIMTALLAIECGNLDQTFKVPKEAVNIEGSSMYLTEEQTVSVRDLLYGLMLKSGNDAAVALAVHCDKSVAAFAERMNKKASDLGMKNTRFENPHGLNAENHYSTARDMAILTRAALQNEIFSSIVSSKFAKVGDITIKNHNRMLWSYQGADGVKTGYTIDAGRCLVSSATRGGMRLIVVTLDDRNDWADHAALLDYGFENYALHTICRQNEEITTLPVFGGTDSYLSVRPAKNVRILLPRNKSIETSVSIPRYFWAPVIEGQRVGMITAVSEGKVLAHCPLLAAEGIQRSSR